MAGRPPSGISPRSANGFRLALPNTAARVRQTFGWYILHSVTRRDRLLVLVGILGIAAFARLWQITTMPGGLFPDQAANGEDALAILQGDIRPFYERGNGREGLFFYLQAATLALFGIQVWPMFLGSAIVGIFTVFMTYAAGGRLFGHRVGLFAALFLATNPWHVTLSRTGFRAILVPLFIALALFFGAGIVRTQTTRRRILEALGAGISFGLGWYTYIAYRVFPAVLLILGIMFFIEDAIQRPRFAGLRRYGGGVLIAVVTAMVVTAPLGWYFLEHPGSFAGRVSHVSVLNPDLQRGDVTSTVVTVFRDSVLAFFTAGDLNPRHNVSGFPFLSPIPAMFLIVGLAVSLVRTLQYFHRLLRGRPPGRTLPFFPILLLAIMMLAPAVATAEGIPHGLRSIGEIPAVFWLAGIGAAWILHHVERFPSLGARSLARGVIGVLVLLTIGLELFLYFGAAAASPKFWYEYRSDLTTVSKYLAERSRSDLPDAYLTLDAFSEQTVHFLTTEAGYPYHLIRPEESHVVTLRPDEVIVFTQSTLPDAERYQETHPEVGEADRRVNQFGETTMVVYALERL